MTRYILTISIALLLVGPVAAQEMVRDINAGASSAAPRVIRELNGKLYFSARSAAEGRELWTSDLTGANTRLVADINVGALDSDPDGIEVWNNRLYFRADDGANGIELWQTDGTTTTMVADINPGLNGSNPKGMTVFNNELYFRATRDDVGRELFKIDTSNHLTLVRDINPDTLDGSPTYLTEFNGQLYFRARHVDTGRELWRTDGTSQGTELVKDIRPGELSGRPYELIVHNDKLFFGARTDATGDELWVSDGSESGTEMMVEIYPDSTSSTPDRFISTDLGLFFRAVDPDNGKELWVSDGTAPGTQRLTTHNGTLGGSPNGMTWFNHRLFFRSTTPASGRELWSTDGTIGGTVQAADVNPGTQKSSPSGMTAYDGKLFFRAERSDVNVELFSYDPEDDQIKLIMDIREMENEVDSVLSGSIPSQLRVFNDMLVFSANDGVSGRELWKYQVPNQAPVAQDAETSTREDEPLVIQLVGTDPDGDALTFALTVDPTQGVASISGDQLSYTPGADYFGPDSLSFSLTDPRGGIDTGVVRITVDPVNDPPVADPLDVTVDEDNRAQFSVVATDIDEDGTLQYLIVDEPSHGVAILSGASGTYDPDPDYFGADSLRVRVIDSHGLTDEAMIRLRVSPVNDPPTAEPVFVSVQMNGNEVINLLESVSDIDDASESLTLTITSPAGQGQAILNGDGTLSYTPNQDYVGADSLRYQVDDGEGLTAEEAIRVTVFEVNTAPTALAAEITTDEDTAVSIDLQSYASDDESASSLLEFSILADPVNGSIEMTSGSTVRYTPNQDYSGSDSLRFKATDSGGLSDEALIQIAINAINDAPQVQPIDVSSEEDQVVQFALNGMDVENDQLMYEVVTATTNGQVQISDSVATYTPAQDFNGQDSFTYRALDNEASSDTALVTINVQATGESFLQFVHLTPATAFETVDLSLSGTDWIGNAATGTATPLLSVADGTQSIRLEGAGGAATELQADLDEDASYALILFGEPPSVALISDLESVSGGSGVGIRPFNGVASEIDVEQLDMTSAHAPIIRLGEDLAYGSAAATYTEIDAGVVNISFQLPAPEPVVSRLDLSQRAGSLGVLVALPSPSEAGEVATYFVLTTGEVDAGIVSTSSEDDSSIPATLAVRSVYPNPTSGDVTIELAVPQSAEFVLTVFDLLGRKVADATTTRLVAGVGQGLQIDTSEMATGVYFYRISTTHGNGSSMVSGKFAVRR